MIEVVFYIYLIGFMICLTSMDSDFDVMLFWPLYAVKWLIKSFLKVFKP